MSDLEDLGADVSAPVPTTVPPGPVVTILSSEERCRRAIAMAGQTADLSLLTPDELADLANLVNEHGEPLHLTPAGTATTDANQPIEVYFGARFAQVWNRILIRRRQTK